jgi:small-conductance mechanosensitive channel
VLHVPNSLVLSETIINYTEGFKFIWDELLVLVTFESNWEKAKDILFRTVSEKAEQASREAEKKIKEAGRKYLIFYKNLTPIVYTSVKSCGVMLSVRYLTEPRSRRGKQHELWEIILTEFKKHDDIDFAYPTQRFYDNTREGKPETINIHSE